MLQKEAEPEEPETAGQASIGETQDADADDDDEDEIIAPRPRKLQQRRQRSKTPEVNNPKTAQSPAVSVSRDRSESPMFFSPVKLASPSPSNADGLDSDPDIPSIANPRFKALVAKKRQERLAREAEEARKKAARLAAQQAAAADDGLISDDGDDSNVTDDEGGIKLTQGARPTRKASKKALEDISRETQRLTRSLQLAHEAKTKKKITKASLFERFNFRPEGAVEEPKSSSRPASPTSVLHTDLEMKDTPPSSPPVPGNPEDNNEKTAVPEANADTFMLDDDDDDLPTLEATFEAAREAAAEKRRQIKGKGKATEADLQEQEKPKPKRNIRVRLPVTVANLVTLGSDDDDDLDIIPSKPKSKVQEILDRVPANKARESRPMFVQRRLANLDDPDRKGSAPNGRRGGTMPSLTAAEHQALLLQKARLQAKREREERLERLRAKGVHIQTEEEREKERAEVEDIVAAARREAEEIMLREREAAKQDKKDRKAAGEVDPLAWDDSDASDDDYQGEDEEEEKAIELSGSEEEEEDEEMGDEEDEVDPAKDALVDDAAESGVESQGEADEAEPSDDEALALPRQTNRRPKKHVAIISDDEDDSDHHVEATPRPKTSFFESPSASNTASPKIPASVLRSATKTFIPGLPVAGPAGLGLTQIFAGTMDDSQAGPLGGSPSQMAPDFDAFPDSNFSQTAQEPSEDMILDSQAPETQAAAETQNGKVNLHFSQSQMQGFDSLLRETDTQAESDMLEPTQDQGFQEYTPLKKRFADPPQSTVDTLVLGETQSTEQVSESPLVQRAGKLRRRADVKAAAASVAEDEEDTPMDDVEEFDEFGFGTTSAFNVMKDAAVKEKKQKAKADFNKKKSKAREMIEEQAEESEDEYAGLGGVDGEDSDNESDASVQEMIDNDTKLSKDDEAKMKAFYA
jgi:mediator of replication checkpoint protein 1